MGPVSTSVAVAMIQKGSISPETMMWHEGMSSWMPASGIPELAGVLTTQGEKKQAALGLTSGGLVLFIVLLLFCLPLCWLPWVISSMKADK